MRQALEMALKFIERVNKEGWILADFEPEMYKVINAIKEELAQEQEPVAMLERDPSIGRLRVTYEDAVTELDEGVYPLYTKPQGWRDNVAQAYLKGFDEASSQHGCAECGANDGHALYCVRCAEKFVGGYKESVPVHTSELLTQVSTDTQYAGNGTAGIQNETKPTGFFFQMPPQRTWVGLTQDELNMIGDSMRTWNSWTITDVYFAIEAKLKEKNT